MISRLIPDIKLRRHSELQMTANLECSKSDESVERYMWDGQLQVWKSTQSVTLFYSALV
jgi:hypothetical protein